LRPDLSSSQAVFAVELLRASAKVAVSVKAQGAFAVHSKEDHSPVTIADMAIQAVAGCLIDRYFPGVPLVAEENATELRRPEGAARLREIVRFTREFIPGASPEDICDRIDRGTSKAAEVFWTLDPIDGTKGYLRGGQYVTALALIRNGKVEFSALGCPELALPGHEKPGAGVILLAIRERGCWASPLCQDGPWERLRVSSCRDITRARILDSCDPGHKNAEKNAFIRNTLGIVAEPVAMDSQAKHATLASGGAEIFSRTPPRRDPAYCEKIWDVAPGAFVIEEAGGCVTDLSGDPIDYGTGNILKNNHGFVATNGVFHGQMLEAIREAVAALRE
jgi:3'(2'), 5'-bisphosphate nucleotidase